VALGALTGIGWLDQAITTILNWLLGVLGWVLIAALSTITATMIIGFFTPYIVREIHRRHYPDVRLEGGISVVEYLWLLFKSFLKFLGVGLLSVIFYFIPLLNYIAFHIPFYYLFSTLMTLDVGGEIFTKRELEEALKSERTRIYSTTLGLYLITLIPLAGMLLQVYFVSVMAHLFLQIKRKRGG
jgi:uncharacterized protein involved in cysteine biosynthesis